ncbi:hypothetical protein B0H11DRAFT_1934832 [Mycena galericulata]|nr:hypothetical protein B0H11DRAFT_1934832 [Mycena galericulata]
MELLRGTNPGCAFLVKTYGEGIFDTPVWLLKITGGIWLCTFLATKNGTHSESADILPQTNERAGSPRLPGTLSAYLFQLGLYSDALSLCQKSFDPQNPPEVGGTAFDPPHRDMTAERRSSGCPPYGSDSGIHTLGRLPEARQYREDQPANLIQDLRANRNSQCVVPNLNCPKITNHNAERPSAKLRIPKEAEDAQSYPWRLQEHWMKSDVWEWEDNNANVKSVAYVMGVKRWKSTWRRISVPEGQTQIGPPTEEKSQQNIRKFGAKVPKQKKATK